jgi:CelD/BcsL family acetyltransferase involved in cellulose biosynthesis
MPTVNAFTAANSYAPVAGTAPKQIASRARAEAIPLVPTAPIGIECAGGARLDEIESDWRDLIGRAHEPNVFMSPALVRAAEQHLADRRYVILLAWQDAGRAKALVGAWAFAVTPPPHSPLPVRVLHSPAIPHGYLATPVVDRTVADDALHAMLDFVDRAGDLPKTLVLDPICTDGPTMQALERVLRARRAAPFVMARAQRPVLASDLDGAAYFEKALSASSRKKLRQYRRRLAEKGALTLKVCDAPDAVGKAFEEFLELEAAGWKGRRGSALLCKPAEAAFARAMVSGLARRGAASVHALYLDERPVSMQVVLRAGSVAFTWKTAYDEAMHDFSPGMLLLEDYTKAFLGDDSIARVDSCAYDESSFMAAWSERQEIAQMWIDVRRGSSPVFLTLCRLQKVLLALRGVAKRGYVFWRRKWKKN